MLLKMIMTERSQSYKTKKPVSNRFFLFYTINTKDYYAFSFPSVPKHPARL